MSVNTAAFYRAQGDGLIECIGRAIEGLVGSAAPGWRVVKTEAMQIEDRLSMHEDCIEVRLVIKRAPSFLETTRKMMPILPKEDGYLTFDYIETT